MKRKTINDKKVLLIYNGHKIHPGIKALDILKKVNFFVYYIPAHTSSLLQLLNVSGFGLFKKHLRDKMNTAVMVHHDLTFDHFNCLYMIKGRILKLLMQQT